MAENPCVIREPRRRDGERRRRHECGIAEAAAEGSGSLRTASPVGREADVGGHEDEDEEDGIVPNQEEQAEQRSDGRGTHGGSAGPAQVQQQDRRERAHVGSGFQAVGGVAERERTRKPERCGEERGRRPRLLVTEHLACEQPDARRRQQRNEQLQHHDRAQGGQPVAAIQAMHARPRERHQRLDTVGGDGALRDRQGPAE